MGIETPSYNVSLLIDKPPIDEEYALTLHKIYLRKCGYLSRINRAISN
jgi:hypothetical protein